MEFAENTHKKELIAIYDAVDAPGSSGGFSPEFLDDERCQEFLFTILHRNGSRCPECNGRLNDRKTSRFWHGKTVKCSGCGKIFTAKTGTILAGKSLNAKDILLMFWLIKRNFSDIDIAKIISCHRETVRLWRQMIGNAYESESTN
ncbi:MAG: transposase [Thermodesulfobacteriota bacterium]|nr:transposase [Thermodesulfobacteriota bacterium]